MMLKIKKTKGRDPVVEDFEDLDLEEQAPHEAYNRSVVRSRYPNFWFGAFLVACLLVTVGMGTYWLLTRSDGSSQPSHVYVEMKVIDETGHPVAGADVFFKKKRIGVTDSFGEWRRFLKTRLGATIPLLINKETEHGTVSVTKNIAVPLRSPKTGEVEVHTSVRLSRQAQSRGDDPAFDREAAVPAPKEQESSSIWFKVVNSQNPTPQVIKREKWLSDVFLSALKKTVSEKTWKLDPESSTQILFQHIELPDHPSFPGLMRVAGHLPQSKRSVDFLANYTVDPRLLARSVFRSLTTTEEETPSFELELSGVPPHSGVYVGGNKASHVGAQKWRYSGKEGQFSYLSIIQKNSVVFRKLVQCTVTPFTLRISQGNLARR